MAVRRLVEDASNASASHGMPPVAAPPPAGANTVIALAAHNQHLELSSLHKIGDALRGTRTPSGVPVDVHQLIEEQQVAVTQAVTQHFRALISAASDSGCALDAPQLRVHNEWQLEHLRLHFQEAQQSLSDQGRQRPFLGWLPWRWPRSAGSDQQSLLTRRFRSPTLEHSFSTHHFVVWRPRIQRIGAIVVVVNSVFYLAFCLHIEPLDALVRSGGEQSHSPSPSNHAAAAVVLMLTVVMYALLFLPRRIFNARTYSNFVALMSLLLSVCFAVPSISGLDLPEPVTGRSNYTTADLSSAVSQGAWYTVSVDFFMSLASCAFLPQVPLSHGLAAPRTRSRDPPRTPHRVAPSPLTLHLPSPPALPCAPRSRFLLYLRELLLIAARVAAGAFGTEPHLALSVACLCACLFYLRQNAIWQVTYGAAFPLTFAVHVPTLVFCAIAAYLQANLVRLSFLMRRWQLESNESRIEQLRAEKERLDHERAQAVQSLSRVERRQAEPPGAASRSRSSSAASTGATPAGMLRVVQPCKSSAVSSASAASSASSAWPAKEPTEGFMSRPACYPRHDELASALSTIVSAPTSADPSATPSCPPTQLGTGV